MNINPKTKQQDVMDANSFNFSKSELSEVEIKLDTKNSKKDKKITIVSNQTQISCNPYLKTKHIKSVVRYKSLTLAISKLHQLYCNLQSAHIPVLQANNLYVGILMNELTKKFWILYLKSKDDFFNVLKFWLLRIENSFSYKLQQLRIDERKKYISIAFRNFVKKNALISLMLPLICTRKLGQQRKFKKQSQ